MKKFSLLSRIQSFKYAFKGMALLFQTEHNAWIHVVLTLAAIGMGWYFNITSTEWIVIFICIGIVLAAEAFNTAIEMMANYIEPNQDEKIGQIKDLAAGGVLFTAISALGVGLIIFLPKIMVIING